MTAPQVWLDIDAQDNAGNYPSGGFTYLYPTVEITDPTDGITITTAPVTKAYSGSMLSYQVYATDNVSMFPPGWAWTLTFSQNPLVPGNPAPVTFWAPAGPCSFSATAGTPGVFTWAPTGAFTTAFAGVLPVGTQVQLSSLAGGSGLTEGGLYYVVSSGIDTFELSATYNGTPFATTGTDSGVFTVTRYRYSGLAPVISEAASTPFVTAANVAATIAAAVAAVATTGPAGPTGPTGSQGIQGATGPEGPSGGSGSVAVETARAEAAEALLAPLNSPAFTGTPAAPTISGTTDSTTKLATTAFVQHVIAANPGPTGPAGPPGTGGGTGNYLALTSVQTSNFTAAANELVPVNTTGGPVTITLPTAPVVGTNMGVKLVTLGGSNAVTVACGGSDVFNKASGPTALTLSLPDQGVFMSYGSGIWYVVADDYDLAQLDIRYASAGGVSVGADLGGTSPAPLVINSHMTTTLVTTTYAALTTDVNILANAASGAFTVTLPTAVGIAGKSYTVKKTDASLNGVTVATTSSQTIDGAALFALLYQNSEMTCFSDGANWQVVNAHTPSATPSWYNIRDFGAKGDGVTDDTAAIAAVFALIAAGTAGGVAYFPAGNYVQTAEITYSSPNAVWMLGDGSQVSQIIGKNTSTNITYYGITMTNPQERAGRTDTACGTTSGSPVVTDAGTSVTPYDKGVFISGAGIPANTYVVSVTVGTGFTMSQNATATASGVSVTFINSGPGGNNGEFHVSDLGFANAHSLTVPITGGPTQTFMNLTYVDFAYFERVGVFELNSQRIMDPFIFNACTGIRFTDCKVYGLTHGITLNGGVPAVGGITITDTLLNVPTNSGGSNPACLLLTGFVETVHTRGLTTTSCERGIMTIADGSGNSPLIMTFDDYEPNSHGIASVDFSNSGGGQWYFHDCFFSPTLGTAPHIQSGSTPVNSIKLVNTSFFGSPGHSLYLGAVEGVQISGCTFGGPGTYKAAANTYDEIHFNSAATSHVSIDNCNFNIEGGMLLGTSAGKVRSAIYVTNGATDITLSNCRGAGSANYGTSGIIDGSGLLKQSGNSGLGFPDSQTGIGATVTALAGSGAPLGNDFVISGNDPAKGDIYWYHAMGRGTNTTGGLDIYLYGNGVNLESSAVGVPQSAFSWAFDAYIYYISTGASGSIAVSWTFTHPGSGAGAILGTTKGGNALSVNTTAAFPVQLLANWTATAGSITCDAAFMKKIQGWPIV